MRLIEIRLLEGPNLYRLEPVIKLEVAIGRRRTWFGQRDPAPHNLVRLGASVPRSRQHVRVAALADWVRRLRREHPDGATGGVNVHQSSDPGFWILTWPWALGDRARAIAEAAFALIERDVRPGPAERLTPRQGRLVERLGAGIAAATGAAPGWIRDPERHTPVVSITGTNGKTTTTRLIAHILRGSGRRVGATTSDGIVIGTEMVEPGDWTGQGGAHAILQRDDLDVAVLETARGGILLRGMGYESNDASVITNVSSDHMDLQGIHTLPELAEVKATIARITKPDGWVVLNADDRYVAEIARRVRARVAFFSLEGDRSRVVRRHLRQGGRAYLVRDGRIGEADGDAWRDIAGLAAVPLALGGVARHNVANALAATGAARAMGASIGAVRNGLHSFVSTSDASRGRLNVFRDAGRIVIVDFAHNEAGVTALLDVAGAMARTAGSKGRGRAGGNAGAGRAPGAAAPITAIIGTAGDRPDDTLRGVGRIAAGRVQRLVIKETLDYLRGRSRASVIGELRAGAREGGWRGRIPTFDSEVAALTHELDRPAAAPGERAEGDGVATRSEVIVLLCHEQRERIFELLRERGLAAVEDPRELARLVAG